MVGGRWNASVLPGHGPALARSVRRRARGRVLVHLMEACPHLLPRRFDLLCAQHAIAIRVGLIEQRQAAIHVLLLADLAVTVGVELRQPPAAAVLEMSLGVGLGI